MVLSIFTELCNCHHYIIPEHFITILNPQPLATTNLLSAYGFACCGHFISMELYNMWPLCLFFFLPLRVMFSKCIHVVACLSVPRFFLWLNNVIVLKYCIFCLSTQLMDICVVCFLAIMNITTMNICVQVFMWT